MVVVVDDPLVATAVVVLVVMEVAPVALVVVLEVLVVASVEVVDLLVVVQLVKLFQPQFKLVTKLNFVMFHLLDLLLQPPLKLVLARFH